ncbi:MAG: hypothetical protein AMXMBFR20_11330 [Planctomycetia bacterium]|jgi:hypothetical protein|nr:MAG: hypothetical protein B6D36_19310 [Planctomycetes bacterium UTPLA1]
MPTCSGAPKALKRVGFFFRLATGLTTRRKTIKVLVYLDSEKKPLQDVAAPRPQNATDAIVRMTHTTICGGDLHVLHLLKGDVPEVTLIVQCTWLAA